MKRTVFSLLLALVMALAALPVAAAEGELATVNGTPCADLDAVLEEAAELAASGTAVTIVLQRDAEVPGTLPIQEGWEVTLDLNGHSLSAPAFYYGRSIYLIENNGTLTLCDTSSEAGGVVSSRGIKNRGTLHLRSGTVSSVDADSDAAAVWNTGIFEMTGGRLEAVGRSKEDNNAFCLVARGAGIVNITGGELASTGACVLSEDSALVQMEGVSLTGGQCASAVTISENSICSMKNVTISAAGGSCAQAAGGMLELTGCLFVQTGAGGSALAVSDGGTITVDGGNYSGGTAALVSAGGGTIHILDGGFSGTASALQALSGEEGRPFVIRVSGGMFTGGLNIGENAALFLSGGTFDRRVDEKYLEQGRRLRDNGDGTFTVEAQAPVASVDGKDYYTLKEAMDALPAAADKTLILKADAALERMLDLSVEGMTLDLNGHTVTAAENFAFEDSERNDAHLINVSADDVTIKNGTVKTGAVNKHAVNLFEASGAVLEDLTLDHTDAWKGTPLAVNASAVTVKGRLDLLVGPASWYGVNIDPKESSARLVFADGSAVSMTGGNAGGLDVIRLDGDLNNITVSGAEGAGLVRTGENSYGFAPVTTPTPSPTPTPSASPSPTASPAPTATPGRDPVPTPAPTAAPGPTATPVPRPTTVPAPVEEEGPVTAEVETRVKDGTAVAEVTQKELADAVKQAISRATEGEGPAVTLKLDTADADAMEVTLPSGALAALARQEDSSLTVAGQVAQVTFDCSALSSIVEQAGEELTLAAAPVAADSLNQAQATVAGQFPVMDLTLRSNSQLISDFGGGSATVTLPHDLALGQSPEGVVVWYLDDTGSITPCDTRYDPVADKVTFTTGHFSKYVIAYNEALVPAPPQRPSYSLPEDERLRLVLPLTIAGVAVVLLVFFSLLVQLILTGRKDKWRR